jgi:hypothetical protein
MPNETTTAPQALASRSSDDVEVALLWHRPTSRLTVSVQDSRTDEAFEFEVDAEAAFDAFDHYAYSAFRGIGYRGGAAKAGGILGADSRFI